MPKEIVIPRLGWSMEEGVFSEWLKGAGQMVRAGEMLFVLEGEKAAQEIESFDTGTLCIPSDAPRPGEVVRVGQVIGFLLAAGEPAPESVGSKTPPQAVQPDQAKNGSHSVAATNVGSMGSIPLSAAPGTTPAGGVNSNAVNPLAVASVPNVSLPLGSGSMPSPPVRSDASSGGASTQGAPSQTSSPDWIAGPAARRLARELGLNRVTVSTPDPTGRVRTEDLRRLASARPNSGHDLPTERSDNLAAVTPGWSNSSQAVQVNAASTMFSDIGVSAGDAVPTTGPAIGSTRAEGRPLSTPRARRRAAELGVDWTRLGGSGHQGRIREQDVLAAYERQRVTQSMKGYAARTSASHTDGSELRPTTPGTYLAASKMRLVVARRMQAGLHQAAPVTLTTKVDASALVQVRERWKRAVIGERVPAFHDLLIKLVATVLTEQPVLNACWYQDGIWSYDEIHIAMAVDTEWGLQVPVIRHADRLTVAHIAEQSQRLIELARSGRLTQTQLEGGTFTVTNLGMFGVDTFTPVLNLPQAGILGVGRVVTEPVVRDGRLEVGQSISLSLTFDHRVTDGGPAARWLQRLTALIQQPDGIIPASL